MEINTNYYMDMLERFKRLCPWLVDDIDRCRPKSMHAIRIELYDGTLIDYNARTDAFRFITGSDNIPTEDISDESCRSVFAVNLQERMHERGHNQSTLAKSTGLSTVMISKYLSEKATPSVTNLKKIARALDCHYDELLE